MTEEFWQQIRSHFEQASELTGDAREKFLLDLRRTAPDLADQVGGLLASSGTGEAFLETPPWSASSVFTPANAFAPGQVLEDRFEVKALLGSGGVGEVYRAFDRHRNCDVALKTVRPALLFEPEAQAALRNELNLAALVSHPNVCRWNDITLPRTPGSPAFVSMELLEGETLAALMKRRTLTAPERLEIIRQITEGLAAAHARGIVHRDLKPSNIMISQVDGKPRVVIMDFGLAREMKPGDDYKTALTTDYFAGTPAYKAPEQLQGKRATVASDLHALGVILYQMATGTLPFDGATPIMIASARLHQSAPRPSSIDKDVDPPGRLARRHARGHRHEPG